MTDPDLHQRVLDACATLGWSEPRSHQRPILDRIFAGEDLLAVLPTGAGKSGIFQIPALARPGMVVVVSPLVALMRDQVDRLARHGVAAVTLNSHTSQVDARRSSDLVRSGGVKLLYLSPERMASMDPEVFGDAVVQMYVIDEAHCISEWGHDFRPAYLRLGKTLSRFPAAQRLALTATATEEVCAEITAVLRMTGGVDSTVRMSPDRPNLLYGVAGRKVSLVQMVGSVGLPAIVYGSTRKGVEEAASQLARNKVKSAFYHAGMTKDDRRTVQDAFTAGEVDVIVATNAFGMGIDHPGIRGVIHLEMPTSLEAYIQETGRAGRGGQPARALCRATVETLDVAKGFVPLTWPSPGRIRMFWERFSLMFDEEKYRWVGPDQIQLSDVEIGSYVGMPHQEVASAVRILADAGMVRFTPYRDRPVRITLLSGGKKLKGKRQRQVLDALEDHADLQREVVGSVAFFADVIGLDKPYAAELNEANAIRFEWVDRCQVIERCHQGDLQFDEARVVAIRKRAVERIEAARSFLYTPGCRRAYLLSYFGAEVTPSDGPCCDRCLSRGAVG